MFQKDRNSRPFAVVLLVVLMAMAEEPATARAERIKDLVRIEGVRPNQLIGFGLVIGLQGTGDGQNTGFTVQTIANLLSRMGMRIDPGSIRVKNVAAVMVTAELPPFSRPGNQIDIKVASIGDAKSLEGGVLLFTPLRGADNQFYAVAQGPVTIGGFGISEGGTGRRKNHLTTGMIPEGATVEAEIPSAFWEKTTITLALKSPDFTTASRCSTGINLALGGQYAHTLDSGTVEVQVPPIYLGHTADFVAALERVEVQPDRVARVVINERTGTVVVGAEVRISTVAISHGGLNIEIRERVDVSQPNLLTVGQTTVTAEHEVQISELGGEMQVIEGGVSIGELARALNAMGVSPRDLVAIFQALRAAGALNAEIVVQ